MNLSRHCSNRGPGSGEARQASGDARDDEPFLPSKLPPPRERVVLDAACLARLQQKYGARGVERYVEDQIIALSRCLSWIDQAYGGGGEDVILSEAFEAEAICQDLGFLSLAGILRDLIDACGAASPTTCAAIVNRLIRVADLSMAEFWEQGFPERDDTN